MQHSEVIVLCGELVQHFDRKIRTTILYDDHLIVVGDRFQSGKDRQHHAADCAAIVVRREKCGNTWFGRLDFIHHARDYSMTSNQTREVERPLAERMWQQPCRMPGDCAEK